MYVIIYLRKIHQLIDKDVFGCVEHDSPFPDNDVDVILLLPELLHEDFFGDRLIVEILGVESKMMKT